MIHKCNLLFSRGTHKFSVHVSNDPDSTWVHVLTDTLPSAQNMDCVDIGLHTYNLKQNGRYMKLVMKNYYGKGAALKYINVNYE